LTVDDAPSPAGFRVVGANTNSDHLHVSHDSYDFSSDRTSVDPSLQPDEDAHPAVPHSPSNLMDLAGAHPVTPTFQDKVLEHLFHQFCSSLLVSGCVVDFCRRETKLQGSKASAPQLGVPSKSYQSKSNNSSTAACFFVPCSLRIGAAGLPCHLT
jgi:hypothetical protein